MTMTQIDPRSLRVPSRWTILSARLPQGSFSMSPIKILFAFAAMLSLLMVFAIQRIPSPEPIVVPTPSIPAADAQTTVVKKTEARVIDMSRAAMASTDPVPVVTERVRPDPAPSVPALVALPTDAEGENGPEPKYKRRTRERYASTERNICTRHGLRKVITRGGRSWRCR
jgi:hypothetical protein